MSILGLLSLLLQVGLFLYVLVSKRWSYSLVAFYVLTIDVVLAEETVRLPVWQIKGYLLVTPCLGVAACYEYYRRGSLSLGVAAMLILAFYAVMMHEALTHSFA